MQPIVPIASSLDPNDAVDPMAALDAGIDSASAIDDAHAQAKAQEKALVKTWWERIERARKFDDAARKRYVKDRKYARGDFNNPISVNIIGTYIDIWVSFLYAKDPDVDVLPARTVGPLSVEQMMAACQQQAEADPQLVQKAMQAGQQAAHDIGVQNAQMQDQAMMGGPSMGGPTPPPGAMPGGPPPGGPPQGPPPDPVQAAMDAGKKVISDAANQACQAQRDAYTKRQREKKEFSDTLRMVIERLWKSGRIKRQARRVVRSALTVGIGWFKVSWFERMGQDPVILQQINDIQDNIGRVTALKATIADGSGNQDSQLAELTLQIEGLQAKVEKVVSKGMAYDFVRAENITVSEAVDNVMDYLDAPFISHRCFMRPEEAQALCPKIPLVDLRKAVNYSQRKPSIKSPDNPLDASEATEADEFVKGSAKSSESVAFLCIEEVWDHDSNHMLTLVEGIERFGRDPVTPNPAFSQFYPFVALAFTEVDGDRHPQSLNSRSHLLQDDVNRSLSGFSQHRARVKPKTMFNKGILPPADAKKLEGGVTAEMVGIKPTGGAKIDLRTILTPVVYPQLDPGLYDNRETMHNFELIWGTQEALSGSISVAKTATEAQIQDKGTNARTNDRRDLLEGVLTQVAMMTAEASMMMLKHEDVITIAGPEAFWPEGVTVEQLDQLAQVDIRAGSSGRPDTAMDREAWTAIAPVLRDTIQQIGSLRQSSPSEMADRLEELAVETIERSGDRLEVDRFIPQGAQTKVGDAGPPPQQGPIQEQCMTGPQVTSLLAILADVAGKIIPKQAGMAAVMAAYPHISTDMVQGMFASMDAFVPPAPPMPKGAMNGSGKPAAEPHPPSPF